MLKARYNKITIVEETAEQFVTEEFAMTLALGKPPETKSSGLMPSFPIYVNLFLSRRARLRRLKITEIKVYFIVYFYINNK